MRSIFQPGFGVPPTSIASSRRRRSGDWDIPIHCLQKRPIWYEWKKISLIWNTGWKGRDKRELIAVFCVAAYF